MGNCYACVGCGNKALSAMEIDAGELVQDEHSLVAKNLNDEIDNSVWFCVACRSNPLMLRLGVDALLRECRGPVEVYMRTREFKWVGWAQWCSPETLAGLDQYDPRRHPNYERERGVAKPILTRL